jgi:hypothetical protein
METRVLPEALSVINVGLESFADDLRADGVTVVQMDCIAARGRQCAACGAARRTGRRGMR